MMLLIATSAHFFKTPDNVYWCDSVETYDFWSRYLDIFEKIRVVARVKCIDKKNPEMNRADGERMEVWEVPFYQGPVELAKKYLLVRKALKGCFEDISCALYRMPDALGQLVLYSMPGNIPYAGEVVINLIENVRLEANILYKIIQYIRSNQLKKFCKRANGVAYVTQNAIQKYYPSYCRLYGESEYHFEASYSSANIENDFFYHAREYKGRKELKIVMSDAAMSSNRKGESEFIEIIQRVRENGYDVSGVIIGDGSMRESFEKKRDALGLKNKISFVGMVTHDSIKGILKKCDIFLLATKREGLPRAIIEAMSMGMPVLSTKISGNYELLPEKYLFHPDDIKGFSECVCRLFDNQDELEEMSRVNFCKSFEYKNEILQKKRNHFYSRLKQLAFTNQQR